jgi:hypothetical protein
VVLSTVGLISIFLIYYFITELTKRIEAMGLEQRTEDLYIFGAGLLNGTLNFILSLFYNKTVALLIYTENHA